MQGGRRSRGIPYKIRAPVCDLRKSAISRAVCIDMKPAMLLTRRLFILLLASLAACAPLPPARDPLPPIEPWASMPNTGEW